MGVIAQDFWSAFGLGKSERHLSTVDGIGVSMAAIIGLDQRVDELAARHAERLGTLAREHAALREQLDAPRTRLDAVEGTGHVAR